MGFKFNAPCCAKRVEVKDGLQGRKLECPFCGTKFIIPGEPTAVTTEELKVATISLPTESVLEPATLPPPSVKVNKSALLIAAAIALILLLGAYIFKLMGEKQQKDLARTTLTGIVESYAKLHELENASFFADVISAFEADCEDIRASLEKTELEKITLLLNEQTKNVQVLRDKISFYNLNVVALESQCLENIDELNRISTSLQRSEFNASERALRLKLLQSFRSKGLVEEYQLRVEALLKETESLLKTGAEAIGEHDRAYAQLANTQDVIVLKQFKVRFPFSTRNRELEQRIAEISKKSPIR
jgi:hypothetical protein